MFIRFVVHNLDVDSGRRQGLFQALDTLNLSGQLNGADKQAYFAARDWFRVNLKTPDSFARASRPHAKKVALSWFKDTASEHIRQMYGMAEVLKSHEVAVEVLRTNRPGYVVYEDEYQIAAEPFTDTRT
ncbi:hypothetical protein [Ottowia thiooxydans]|uniref:hypothetical protein n=1 Tax=Ottowia thiooxydans TaxID=219182 RepID=UPI0004193923|nr:hypothetical protein [Ottowia thiooxydans]